MSAAERWLEYRDGCSTCFDFRSHAPVALLEHEPAKDGILLGYRCDRGHHWKCGWSIRFAEDLVVERELLIREGRASYTRTGVFVHDCSPGFGVSK